MSKIIKPDLHQDVITSDCDTDGSYNDSVDSDDDTVESEAETQEGSSKERTKRRHHRKLKIDDTSFENEISGNSLVALLDRMAQKYNNIFDEEDIGTMSLLRDGVVGLEKTNTECKERLNALVCSMCWSILSLL